MAPSVLMVFTATSAAFTSFRTPYLRARRFSITLEICAISSNEFRGGTNIELDGAPWLVQGGSKPATTETGTVVNVPLFVNKGDSIQVDTRTGQYVNRASV